MSRPSIICNIVTCARCEQDHFEVEFKLFILPIDLGSLQFTHWGMCPIFNEPIIITIPDDETAETGKVGAGA